MPAMNWKQLLSRRRLGVDASDGSPASRSDFQRDFDRIVFSSAFRRLQDKTQVFALGRSDYVRTRLTHSMEVASVGRSLGALVGAAVLEKSPQLRDHYSADDFGAIVAAACLMHDIGNPPFGHAGEAAIQEWFLHSPTGRAILEKLPPRERRDFERFEGNAQGFRIVCRLQNLESRGGMQLTCATLAACAKYPRASDAGEGLAGSSARKHGFMADDAGLFREVAAETGMLPRGTDAWRRHPLAFLVEAADDICYRIVDVEDGFRTGQVGYADVKPLFLAVVGDEDARRRAFDIASEEKRIEYLRARAINTFITECAAAFAARERELLSGAFDAELASVIPHAAELEAFRALGVARVYVSRPAHEIAAPGSSVLGNLLEAFVGSVNEIAEHGKKASARAHAVVDLLPSQFRGSGRTPEPDLYRRVLQLTDYVAGMTDSYAYELRGKLRGLGLPSN